MGQPGLKRNAGVDARPGNLTAMDELILKLLYHPDLECGMTARQCEEIIRQLYY